MDKIHPNIQKESKNEKLAHPELIETLIEQTKLHQNQRPKYISHIS